MNRYLFLWLLFCLFISALCLTSCGHKQWSNRGYKKGWIKTDTVYKTVTTESSSADTVFKHTRDTVILKENKLTVKYFYNNNDSTIYLSGECEGDTIRVPQYITSIETKESNNWMLFMMGFCLALIIALLIISRIRR